MARVLEVKYSSAVRQAAALHTHNIIRKELSEPCKTEHKQIQSFNKKILQDNMSRTRMLTKGGPAVNHILMHFTHWAPSMGQWAIHALLVVFKTLARARSAVKP